MQDTRCDPRARAAHQTHRIRQPAGGQASSTAPRPASCFLPSAVVRFTQCCRKRRYKRQVRAFLLRLVRQQSLLSVSALRQKPVEPPSVSRGSPLRDAEDLVIRSYHQAPLIIRLSVSGSLPNLAPIHRPPAVRVSSRHLETSPYLQRTRLSCDQACRLRRPRRRRPWRRL